MKTFLLLSLLFIYQLCSSQTFITKIGLGLGGVFEQKFPGCTQKDNGKIMASFSQFYTPGKKYSLGLQAIASGRLFSILGGIAPCQTFDNASNKTVIGFNNLDANSLLIRNRFTFLKKTKVGFYGDLGVGLTTYKYNRITREQGKVSKTNFAVSPQIGFTVSRFDFACMMIFGGRTPSFEGYDSFSARNVSLSSIRSQQLYLMLGFDLFKFK